jgi:predicted protein tyrosine phosphatase
LDDRRLDWLWLLFKGPMEFFVYSRRALEAARPHEVPYIVISITSGPDDVARLQRSDQCRGVLRLSFPDAEAPSGQFTEGDLFSQSQATQIWDFVLQHQAAVQRIVLHCDAGVSRSPAVAAAVARALGADNAEFFSGRYHPNMRVYRLLLQAAPRLTE